MRQRIPLEEDLALKQFVGTPADQKPRFNWSKALDENNLMTPNITVEIIGKDQQLKVEHVANMVGSALTDLLLSKEEKNIYTPENRQFVADISLQLYERLKDHAQEAPILSISQKEVDLLLEKILVKNNAYDVAKSLLVYRACAVPDVRASMELQNEGRIKAVRLIRRNGQVVPWNTNKIEVAVRKAFLSLEMDSEAAVKVAQVVAGEVKKSKQAFIDIEDVQDLVQETLMRLGHFKVAEAYILYRASRAEKRRIDKSALPSESLQESMIVVQSKNGESYFWDPNELYKRIEFSTIGLDLSLSSSEIKTELLRSIYPEMTKEALKQTIILNAKSLIEKDADFAKFAGRILLTYIYEEALGWDITKDGIEALKFFHKKQFKKYLEHSIAIQRLSPELLNYDLEKLAEQLDFSADLDFDYLGIQTLYDRYLIIDKTTSTHRRIETPQFFWMRVAMGIFYKEQKDKDQWAIKLYHLYKSRLFCSSTPTLFNSGTLRSQLSSCYLYKVDDSIESIMYRGIAENAFLSKYAGGLGGSWTAVRGTNGYIRGTNGESQGVIPFLKLHNDQLVAVNQGGKRRGAGCAYLETWHNDIIDFLELRKNTGDDRRRTHDMNTANWVPDLFMKRMESRGDWTLFNSGETPDLHELYGEAFEKKYCEYEKLAQEGKIFGKKVPAIELWKKMLSMLFETGHPWITFKDPCNIRNPQDHVGVIHSSNLCTEITLNTGADETAVCNLGSIVLDTHIDSNGNINLNQLKETVRIAVRALDNIIDINFYPTEPAKNSNYRHRPIGLGLMGLQNALHKKHISFASDAAIEFNDEFMEAIAYFAYEASSDLAAQRGTYTSYKGSKWDRGLLPQDTLSLLEKERGVPLDIPLEGKLDWGPLREKISKQGMRNSNVLAIAPTATISNIMGTSPCIEPIYKNLYVKSNLSGDFIVLNRELVKDLKKQGLWDQALLDQLKYFDGDICSIEKIPEELKKRYLTAFDIPYEYFIKAAARRQKWLDQSQSVNLFLNKPDLKTLSHMYRAAWKAGLKTTYYLRTLAASNIEKATVALNLNEDKGKKTLSDSEKRALACSLEARLNGEECEACQ